MLAELLALKDSKDIEKDIHNAAIEAAISDIYSIKLSTEGTKSRCENVVKLLKGLKNPPEHYEVNW